MRQLGQNLRYSLRVLRKSPAFAGIAVVSLALGIGANTAIFTLINALLLRDLPVRDPERLVQLTLTRPDAKPPLSYPMFRELERGQRVFSDLMGWAWASFNVEVDRVPSLARVSAVTGNYYSGLGISPLLGRLLTPEDAYAPAGGTSQVAVIGYEFWQQHFGASPGVIGKQIRVEGQPFTVVGVTRKWFTGMTVGEPADVTVPITIYPALQGRAFTLDNRSVLWVFVTGRLKDNVNITQARAQLLSIWPSVLQATASTQIPGPRRDRFLAMGLDVTSAATGIAKELRGQFTAPLYVLWGIVGLILLVACVNLANLMLARAALRTQEMSVRIALGASSWSLASQALSDTLLFSFSGAVLGLIFSYWASKSLVRLMTEGALTPTVLDLRPDVRVLAVTVGGAILTGLLVALIPAWHSLRRDPAALLQQGARGLTTGPGTLGKGLITTQIALSLVLLMGAGLFVRTFEKLRSVDLGFAKESLLEFTLNPRPGAEQNFEMAAYRKQLLSRVEQLPGVISGTFSGDPIPHSVAYQDLVAPVSAERNAVTGVLAAERFVWPGFFSTLGVRLVRGRGFEQSDDEKHPAVAVVSTSLAKKLFPNVEAIGQHVRFGVMPGYQDLQIVGVAAPARISDLRDPNVPTIYIAIPQHADWGNGAELFVRTAGPLNAVSRGISEQIDSLGREYAVQIKTVAEVINDGLAEEHVTAMLSAFFAGLGLLLASIGLYGLMSYSVSRRTGEIGIRMALGAHQHDVLRMIVRETAVLALLGIAIGIPCALACTRVISTMLFGVSSSDMATITGVSFLLLVVAIIAGYLPARRASRIDPMLALRTE